jgi:hypothetical protein
MQKDANQSEVRSENIFLDDIFEQPADDAPEESVLPAVTPPAPKADTAAPPAPKSNTPAPPWPIGQSGLKPILENESYRGGKLPEKRVEVSPPQQANPRPYAEPMEPVEFFEATTDQNNDKGKGTGGYAGKGTVEKKAVEAKAQQRVFEEGIIHEKELIFHRVLGTGAQGNVFLCTWKRCFGCSSSSTTVAVKKLFASACTHLDPKLCF